MEILGILIAFIIIILIDLPLLLHCEQKKKTIIVYSCILLLGLIISIYQAAYKHTVTPSDVIETIVKSIIGWII